MARAICRSRYETCTRWTSLASTPEPMLPWEVIVGIPGAIWTRWREYPSVFTLARLWPVTSRAVWWASMAERPMFRP